MPNGADGVDNCVRRDHLNIHSGVLSWGLFEGGLPHIAIFLTP